MIQPICISTRHFFIRLFKGTYDTWDLMTDTSLVERGIYTVIAIYFYQYIQVFNWEEFKLGVYMSLLMVVAR